MRFVITTSDPRPIYVQIMDEIRRGLVLGTLGPGDPLPSVRELAAELRLNPNTVAQAYRELEREGVACVRRGRGTYVAAGVDADRRQRDLLARDVAKRALIDAHRNGIGIEELVDRIRDLAAGAASDDVHASRATRRGSADPVRTGKTP